MLLPSGVWSAAEAWAARRPTSAAVKPSKGTNCVARRLPMVIVPVLSRSSVSTSPATSTAFPLLAMMLARKARSMPAMPMAASRAPIVVGIRHTSRATRVGTSVPRLDDAVAGAEEILHVQLDVVGDRPERGGHDEEDQRERGQHDGEGDFIGRPLADGPFHQGDHAVEERTAGAGGDLDDDPIRKHPRAARDARAVAAGLADHRGRLAGDGRFVDGSHAFDDLAVAGNHVAGNHFHLVSRAEFGGNRLLDVPSSRKRAGRGGAPRLPQGVGLGLAAGLGNGRGEVREQQRRHEPEIQGQRDNRSAPRLW